MSGEYTLLHSFCEPQGRMKSGNAAVLFAALSGLEEYLCLSGIIALLFPNLHTVVGVFKGLLGNPFIAKLFDFAIGVRWCKLCVNVAGIGGGGAGWISCFHVNYICRGRARLVRTSNTAANIASMLSVSKSAQKQEFVTQ